MIIIMCSSAAAVAIEQMGGPAIAWRAGRKNASEEEATKKALPDGRLPNADMGCPVATNSHVRDIFGRMGFNDREIVALCGAHAVGRCHEDASGFWGPWTRAESTFSNEYFAALLNETWTQKKTHNGKPWTGPLQYESKDGTLMMTPQDMALLQDPEFKKYVDMYAKDEELFFKDFSAAFAKLLELGVKF
jgi:cytochrome c peroxidase